ncbi:MAG TPA: FAD binding domain-containing protein, partial [Acidimicrobiia bacterium]|nr:FAD binding domain-containing protein [Acidimicrobiia bacterium]
MTPKPNRSPSQCPTPTRSLLSARPTGTPRRGPEQRRKEAAIYPSRFRYEAPRSIQEAYSLLSDGGGDAKILAGGQSLVPMIKLRFASPEML